MQEQENAFITQQANDWLVKLETHALSEEDEARFIAWLTSDERHGEAFQKAEETWQLMQRSAAETNMAAQSEFPQVATVEIQNKKGWPAWPAIAASLVLVLFSSLWWESLYFSAQSDYLTSTGERQVIELSDGSVLTLNTDSAVTIDFTAEVRQVDLLKGEIHIQVAPDRARPLSIEAGDLKATALGTAFIVKRDNKLGPLVVVTEHQVKVQSIAEPKKETVLQEGQEVTLLEGRQTFTVVEQVDVERSRAWLSGNYIFNNATLEEVLDEVDRYIGAKIILRDKQLAKLKVSGILDLDSPRESLKDLRTPLGINITEVTPLLIFVEKGSE